MMTKGFLLKTILVTAALSLLLSVCGFAAQKGVQWPVPSVRDQVIHNKSNIGVAVVNFGMFGDVYGNGLPSGRWPANSDHDYLAELSFWIGGVTASGDTMLANPSEDFNPIQMLGVADDGYKFLLSTDSTSYDFDPNDTVGIGIGYPAYGWRIWDTSDRAWEYNDVYHSLTSSYVPGGPVAVQESVCRFGDDASGISIMGLEVTQTVRQWNYKHIKDMVVITLQITNASGSNLTDVALGLYCDFDIGGIDLATGENGRLGDMVDIDTDLDLAWTYDVDGYDPGWGPGVRTGLMGTVILGTPGDIGMTSFNTGQWELLPDNDRERFEMINGTTFGSSLPPTDQYYVQGIRGMDLAAGETATIDFALVAGADEDKLKAAAQAAKDLYAAHYISMKPPNASLLRVAAGNQMAALSWTNTAEGSIDPATSTLDFQGYKIYKSSDRGQSWGFLTGSYDDPEYVPLARFELDDFLKIEHSLIDSNLTNGIEYWYALVAFDSTGLEEDITSSTPDNSGNVIRVYPRTEPLGYLMPQETVAHTYTGSWNAAYDSVQVMIVDETAITGDDYTVTFSEDCAERYWHLLNANTGDTVLADQFQFDGSHGTFPIADGLQIVVSYSLSPDDVYLSAAGPSSDSTYTMSMFQDFDPDYCCASNFRKDYEIRFNETGSTAFDYFAYVFYDVIQPITVPFEIWNVTTNTQVDCWVGDRALDGEWTIAHQDYIFVSNTDYEEGVFHPETYDDALIWVMQFDPDGVPVSGDILRIDGPHLASPEDEFAFSSNKINAAIAKDDLDRIHVVPNPYIGYAKWETGNGLRKMQFVNLPAECTIRVYTLAGELIREIRHDNGTGTQDWNMLSESGRSISAGVFLYNVESQYGNYNGKFAVIK